MLEPSELFPEIPNLYEFPSVHADMLFDEERVNNYSKAIEQSIKPGDVVVDIGTGTGLLAFLCLKSGAERVHAIDRSAAIKWAKALSEKNGFSEKIMFYNKDSRETNLPEKADMIVSELIGHIGFEEGMVESLYDAKERFLRPGGKIIPKKVSLRVALAAETRIYSDCIDCWKPIKGIDYSILREEAVRACYLTNINDRDLVSEPQTFFLVDFIEDDKPVLKGEKIFFACRNNLVNGIAIWFDASLTNGISLSSNPWVTTHWKQCFAPVEQPVSVKAGDRLSVKLELHLRSKPSDKFEFAMAIHKL